MANEIDYGQENAHDELLTQKPTKTLTTAQLTEKVRELYDRLHEFIDFHHISKD